MTPKKVFGILMVILIAVIYVLNNNEVKEAVESIVEYTYEGISNLITGNHTGHGLTNSTDIRIDNRDQALNMIAQFDILEYMLGKGYAKPADLSTEKAKNFPGKTGCSLVAVTVAGVFVHAAEKHGLVPDGIPALQSLPRDERTRCAASCPPRYAIPARAPALPILCDFRIKCNMHFSHTLK